MKRSSFFLILIALSCKSNHKIGHDFKPEYTPGPRALIYKTKLDYNDKVPILLSSDRKIIISYPDPKDIKIGGNFQTPTQLKEGYLLDNRGIGNEVAFLKITYEEYGSLAQPPSIDEMQKLIIDKDPLIELCDCGNKNVLTDPVIQLNKLIDEGKLRKSCKIIK